MSARNCRTCGKFIFCSTPKNLFQEPDSVTLHQIEVLTGLFLLEGSEDELPAFMCAPCEMDLREAVSFRERVILTQKQLQSSHSNMDVIDLNESFGAVQKEDIEIVEEVPEIEIIDELLEEPLLEEPPLEEPPLEEEERPLKVFQKKGQLQEKNEEQEKLHRRPSKTRSTVCTSVKFADTNRHMPRTQWDRLTEDEVVALKRERRKRECICEQCGRHFPCPSNFKLHLLRHTGVKGFACDQCPQKFYTATLLRRHQELHAGAAPYPCRYCEASFNNSTGRIQHERIRHTNIKPFKCNECDKSFAMSGKLRTHMLSHTGVRAFHCEPCKVSFVRRSHLLAHFRSKGHAHTTSAQEDVDKVLELDVDTVLESGS
ncbi:transcription factor Ouib [Drosophila rhopaloa]|uniref:Transcription factor Ouib n=1 Tax=Drosophila rhopaloa TaxID=1041015 RepID=A0ABM5HFY2_DRORH|nr:transcription factor Ouib [Drosophila rhopaloa]